mmetsp:Transcript_55909/g.120971  ORF Transcript_55909/g.120971 Transcript_55909/m.120971 type:complete len:200 (-) Transcript_55909:658-1257(-)
MSFPRYVQDALIFPRSLLKGIDGPEFCKPLCPCGVVKGVPEPVEAVNDVGKLYVFHGILEQLGDGAGCREVHSTAVCREMLDWRDSCPCAGDEGLCATHRGLERERTNLHTLQRRALSGQALGDLYDRVSRHSCQDASQGRRAEDTVLAYGEEVASGGLLNILALHIQVDNVREARLLRIMLHLKAGRVVPSSLHVAGA